MSNILERIYNKFVGNGTYKPHYKKNIKRILMYHGATTIEYINNMFHSRSRFIQMKRLDSQFEFYKKYFDVVPLESIFDEDYQGEKPLLALTFDDGLQNNLHYVLPLIEKYQFPATFFVTGLNMTDEIALWPDWFEIGSAIFHEPVTINNKIFYPDPNNRYQPYQSLKDYIFQNVGPGYKQIREVREQFFKYSGDIKEHNEWRCYWKLLSDEEIRRMSESKYVRIGCHSIWHLPMDRIPLTKNSNELKKCKSYLENIVQYPVDSLSYPFGSYNRELVDIAEKAGFKYQLAVNYLYKEDLMDTRIRDRSDVPAHFNYYELNQLLKS